MPATILELSCALCDARLLDGEQHNESGTDGILCGDCHSIVHNRCEGCGTDGVRFGSPWAIVADVRWAMRHRFARDANAIHPECLGNWDWMRWRDAMAEHYANRIADYAPIRDRYFWAIPDDAPMLVDCEDETTRCEDCYSACADCGGAFGHVNLEGLCDSCSMPSCADCGERWETEQSARSCCGGILHSYDFRPDFRYWYMNDGELASNFGAISNWQSIPPSNDLFIGCELETECGYDSFADFLSDAGEDHNQPLFVYGKSDGSLDGSGVEIVTMPATMDAFMARFPWRALQNWNDAGARSYYRESCGFHVHVSRSYFSPTHMWRFVAWQMRNQSFCEMLAQRNSSQWARWQTLGEFGNDYKPSLGDIVKGKESNGERYVAINFQNDATVELRYFRGNLRADAIRQRIEFVDALARFTKNLRASDVIAGALSVDAFANWTMARSERYGTLARWIMDNESTIGRNA